MYHCTVLCHSIFRYRENISAISFLPARRDWMLVKDLRRLPPDCAGYPFGPWQKFLSTKNGYLLCWYINIIRCVRMVFCMGASFDKQIWVWRTLLYGHVI